MGETFMAYHPDPYVRDYDDRGMAKWMGFYLSEHTSEMKKDNTIRNKIWFRKEQMNDLEIGETLDTAFKNRCTVIIQTAELDSEGLAFEDIIGVVEGFNDNTLYISDVDLGVQLVSIDAINNIRIATQEKWSWIS
ncbi:hypothetical protein [Enterococcus gilvus]|uniref:YolD-like protein n=1 Tax=Enterococcus gilvus ATCC BAA-350 TaxID=1158614 RepID=R2XLK0_9ENTE|nr:hypothetical protein [Enterococcus gilvus]EOI55418.1 hypothetical protein UKC_02626 [Enterococcus gilvus ATCC BAA-350]EOW82039.1 hypothetical protein I592_01340 [Enterococcus gilvus ATCC BAA-350]OJG43068.1 hypothetical protein RV02_GL002988 [Enterococcus gilvus]